MDLYKNPFLAEKMSVLNANLNSISERSKDALKWQNKGDYEMVKAELFYLREYLNKADEALKYLEKNE